MVTCPHCGMENACDAKACGNCGAEMGHEQIQSQSTGSEIGESIGKEFDELGKRLSKAIEKDALGWWDRTFGILSPLLAGILATVGFLVFVLIIGAIEASADAPEFWDDFGDFLVKYAWLFVAWGFVSAVQNYLNRKHRKSFRWISPVVSATGFTIFFWVLSNVMLFAGVRYDHPNLVSQSGTVEDLLPAVFIIVAILGYVNAQYERNKEKTAKGQ